MVETPNVVKFLPQKDLEQFSLTSRYMYENALTYGRWEINSIDHLRTLLMSGQRMTHIKFSDMFNEIISPGDLPPETVSIEFGQIFNQRLVPGTIPQNTKTVIFGYAFNQTITRGVLPPGLKTLVFRSIDGVIEYETLPEGLEMLDLGSNYNHAIGMGFLPPSLKTLYLSDDTEQLLPGILPEGLETLLIRGYNYNIEPGTLPSTLKRLEITPYNENFRFDLNSLPESLEVLHIHGDSFDQILEPGILPRNLKVLVFPDDYRMPINPGVLPPGLKYLEFYATYSEPFHRGVLPEGLETLYFRGYYSTFRRQVNLKNYNIPNSLKTLIVLGQRVDNNGLLYGPEIKSYPSLEN
jgi:Leucine-rich repeat (LRR) protein